MFVVVTCDFFSRGLGLRHCGRGRRRPAGAACALRALAAKKLSGLVSFFLHCSSVPNCRCAAHHIPTLGVATRRRLRRRRRLPFRVRPWNVGWTHRVYIPQKRWYASETSES